MDTTARTPTVDELLAHVGWVQALARSLVRDASTADDLAQETWVAALTGKRATDESPRGWLGRVLENRLFERARSERARRVREAARGGDADAEASDALLERIEQQRLLAELLAGLREPLRTTVVLRYYDGLDATRIAARLGERPGTIRQRLKRGLDALREELDRRHEGGREAWLTALLPVAEAGRSVSTGTGAAIALGGALLVKKFVAAVCALALAGAAVLFLRDPDAGAPERAAERAAEVAASAGPPEQETGGGATDAAGEGPRPAVEPASPGREAVVASAPDGHRVHGRVVWPAARPTPDETLEVFALDAPADYPSFVRRRDDGATADVLARTSVAADGGFELAIGPDADVAHLMVRGRHLYLEHTTAVELGGDPSVVLAPVCGALVRGRVVPPVPLPGESARPVAGVRVRLWVDEIFGTGRLGRSRFETVAGEDGRFELRAVLPRPNATLLVAPGPFAARLEDPGGVEACTVLDLELPLFAGGSAEGRVVDESGGPVAGAAVRAILRGRYFGFDDHKVALATTGDDGRFALDALPPGEVYVAAAREGRLESSKRELSVTDRESLTGIVLELSDGRFVAGRATLADGTPAAGARIAVEFDAAFQVGISSFNSLRGASGRAVADANGEFSVVGLGAGPFVVEAELGDGEAALLARADGVKPDSDDVKLVLQPPLELAGTVVTTTGAAVPEFDVRAVRVTDGAVGEAATHERDARGAGGAFAVGGLLAGRWRVEVSAEGFAPSGARTVELPGAEPIAFTLTAPASIAGRVEGPDGAPVEGATVSLDTGRSQWEAHFARAGDVPSATTDARGRFRLAGLAAGECDVRASAEGFAPSAAVAATLVEGEEHAGVALRLARGGLVTGEVWDDGEPAAGRVISLVQWERGGFDTTMEETDAEGRFAFEHVAPGDWTIVAMDLGADWSGEDEGTSMAQRMASMKSARVRVEEGSSEHVVLGVPPKSAVVVRGRVTRGGEPYAGAMLSAESVDAGPTGETNMTGVDARGEYELTVDGAGTYQLGINRMGRAAGELSVFSFLREVPDRPEVVIDLEIPGGGVAGRVVDESGRALQGVAVTLMPGRDAGPAQLFSMRYAQTTSDAEGRFEIADLAGGSYRLSAEPAPGSAGHAGAAGDRSGLAGVVRDGIDLAADTWERDVELVLPRAGTAIVRVLDAFGRPLSGVSVFARDARGAVLHPISRARTDDRGIARYPALAPGAWTFAARDAEFASSREAPAEVRPDETVEVDLPVELGGHLVLTAKGDDGPVPALFQVLDADGRDVGHLYTSATEAQSSALEALAGRLRVGPLPPGSYRVTATTPTGATTTRSVDLRDRDDRKLTLRP